MNQVMHTEQSWKEEDENECKNLDRETSEVNKKQKRALQASPRQAGHPDTSTSIHSF